ncbi:hypothetical protein GQ651_11430 [Alphaproteobacteria bacterium GH1-50]|uniref:Uncharacterized protein n=1 Tax=Kangsaoukella pontilimi TaxID=2691042 RepID=A0A7C9N117_9RHOB|nr:hypothetical protein [Kangsaoukella pontilimi]MXQ08458.1 hypothetical protein [Kangsaoukella pontilimi]
MSDARRFWVTLLFALWALAFGYSFVSFMTTPPDGEGFTLGLNRISAYLGWQGIAGVLSLGLWGAARGWPKGTSARQLSAVPLLLALFHVMLIVGVILWGRSGQGG